MLEKVTAGRNRCRGPHPRVYRRRQDRDGADPERDRAGYKTGAWNATFVGFAPAQNPALTTFIMLSHPDLIYGGLASAPVFSEIMRYALAPLRHRSDRWRGAALGLVDPRYAVSAPDAGGVRARRSRSTRSSSG